MNKSKYSSPIWDKMNIFLTTITAITTIIFIVLFIMSFVVPTNHQAHGMILGMCGVFASLASAFFIAVFMRIFEMCNAKKKQLNALTLLKPMFVEIYTTIKQFYPQLKAFATISSDDTIKYSRERVYYQDVESKGNKDFIDFDIEFSKAKTELDNDLDKCLNSPLVFQCHDSVIELLTNLKLNGLTLNLYEVQKARGYEWSGTSFMQIYENFKKFDEYFSMIAEISDKKVPDSLVLLSEDEKNDYIKVINNIIPQLPPHNGRIYKGNMRIK